MSPALSKSDIVAAAGRLQGLVVRTPALRVPALDELVGAELWIKPECLQRIGAFKARGAMHAVSRLDPDVRKRGVITYSSGNHAQAVALAAKHFGVPASIAMPENAPAVKVEVVRSLGAFIVFAGTTSLERREAALALQANCGGTIIEPFDDDDVICGQGTATLELSQDCLEATGQHLDAMVIPVGGGGLLAGACLALEGTPTKIYAVEPIGCDAMGQSLVAGQRIAVDPQATIADGLKPTMVGERNLQIAKPRVAASFTVDDDALMHALRALLFSGKVLVEPSGAAALAHLVNHQLPGAPERIGIILSGGNVAPDLLAKILALA